MNYLSLFNGMGCFEIALIEAGMPINIMYTSEIDKFCLQQTRLNFPNNIELGDVRNIDVSKLEKIDFLAGGSPCQSFSFAGKRKGMLTKNNEFNPPSLELYNALNGKFLDKVFYTYEDCVDYFRDIYDASKREVVEIYTLEKYLELKQQGFEFEGQSYLFWEYMRILTDIRKYNPDVIFLLENVEMGNKWERVLSEAIGVFGVHINSALVSAQNRKRIYWTNIRVKQVGLFGELHSDIPQPKDEHIYLKDMLESNVDEKYYLSDKMLNYFNKRADNFNAGKVNIKAETDKASCITASCKSVDISDNFVLDTKLKPKLNQTKANCFTVGGHSGGLHSDMDLICVAMRGRNPDNTSDRRTGAPTEQRLEANLSGKTNCLTSVQKDNLVITKNYAQWDVSGKGHKSQQNRAYYENGKMCCIPSAKTESKINIINNSRIRRLTPTECARLQTIPIWYKWIVSDTQQYKMLGNGWTIKAIVHILSFLKFRAWTQKGQ